MSDLQIIVSYVGHDLYNIGTTQQKLGQTLAGNSPAGKSNQPNNSIRYLIEGGEALIGFSEECEQILSTL